MVIGAGEGLGLAFSQFLSQSMATVILIDIQPDKLELAKQSLLASGTAEIVDEVIDAGEESSRVVLCELIKTHNCRLVIFNAAYAPVHHFEHHTAEELDKYLNLNCGTLLHLTHAFTSMRHDGRAGFLTMSSMAGLHGTKYVAAYGASKAFVWNLMEALDAEFKERDFDFCGVCAGAIDTPGFRRSTPNSNSATVRPMTAEDVAYASLMALGRQSRYIPGMGNRLSMGVLMRLLPRRLSLRLVNRTMERMFGNSKALSQTIKSSDRTDKVDQDNHM